MFDIEIPEEAQAYVAAINACMTDIGQDVPKWGLYYGYFCPSLPWSLMPAWERYCKVDWSPNGPRISNTDALEARDICRRWDDDMYKALALCERLRPDSFELAPYDMEKLLSKCVPQATI